MAPGGNLPLQSDRYAHHIFQGIKFLILVFFRVFWNVLCRNEVLIFLGSAHFTYRVKMRSFQNVFSKICIFKGIDPAIWVPVIRLIEDAPFLGLTFETSKEMLSHNKTTVFIIHFYGTIMWCAT